MSVAKVLRLEEYRDRRQYRLKLADALFGVDRSRRQILPHLGEVAELSGADRVATVWLDEYGPGLVHPFLVVDLLSDQPRRSFALAPLQEAWEMGVPGAHDSGVDPGAQGPATFAIALGSDGTRSWFLVADSISPRSQLGEPERERLMFLAGECSAIVLHRDLDAEDAIEAGADQARFAGWPILKDLEGREDDEAEGWKIAQRFVVARLVGLLLDDDLVVSTERAADQVRRGRAELARADGLDSSERRLWDRVLDAYAASDFELLSRVLLSLGEMAEARDHRHGALELYRCGYQLAAAVVAPEPAARAARLVGRLLRRRAQWEEATVWYEAAGAIGAAASLDDQLAGALSGLAVIRKDRGNLPAARETLFQARDVAERSGDRDAIATVYAELLGVEHLAGNQELALQHGWRAVATYESEDARIRGLATLAGALGDFGDRAAAEDAWTIVAHASRETFYRTYAHDALAYLAALRRDGDEFDAQCALCDALDWESGPNSAKSEILYYRGLSCRALGRLQSARRWFDRAISFAEEHGFNRTLFQAEEALASLGSYSEEESRTPHVAPPDVREGVRAMREELVGA